MRSHRLLGQPPSSSLLRNWRPCGQAAISAKDHVATATRNAKHSHLTPCCLWSRQRVSPKTTADLPKVPEVKGKQGSRGLARRLLTADGRRVVGPGQGGPDEPQALQTFRVLQCGRNVGSGRFLRLGASARAASATAGRGVASPASCRPAPSGDLLCRAVARDPRYGSALHLDTDR